MRKRSVESKKRNKPENGSIKISYNIGSVGNVSQFNDNTAGYLIWVIENEIWMRVRKIVAVVDDFHKNDNDNMKYDENNAWYDNENEPNVMQIDDVQDKLENFGTMTIKITIKTNLVAQINNYACVK